MSEHTPLTDAEVEELRRELDTREGSPRHRQMIAFAERLLAARTSTATADPWADCTGAGDCPERWHVHGCFADRGQCDDPTDHHAATADTGLRERVARAEALIDSWDGKSAVALLIRLCGLLATPASTEDRADNEGTR